MPAELDSFVFCRDDFKTVQPAACRLVRALFHRLNMHDVSLSDQVIMLRTINAVYSCGFDCHAPIDSNSREVFVKALRQFVDAEVASVDQTDDCAYESMTDEIRLYSALIEHFINDACSLNT